MDALPEPLRPHGPLHGLVLRAFDAIQQGDPATAERRAAATALLAESLRDEATVRFCLQLRARALVALDRPWEAVAVADELAQRVAHDAQPFWRAKALALRAMALRAAGGHDITDLLAEAWVLTGTPDGRVYDQVSAAILIANVLRSVELYEASDALLSRLWRVVPDDVVPVVLVDGGRTLAEWAVHLSLVQHPDAGPTFARLASRAQLLRRLAPLGDWTGLPAIADCLEALAAHGLGDAHGAGLLLRRLRRTAWPRSASPEWSMATYVAGSLACTAGQYDEGAEALRELREVAQRQDQELWAAASDQALVRADAERFGPHPALAHADRLFRRAAARWSVQQADRFDAVRTRMRLHELLAERDRATVLSRVDALTGVGNRRALQARLDGARETVTAMFIDVDDFKAVNEGHSHVTGDAVLVEVARLIGSRCRPGELLARYGGDEFVLVLAPGEPPGADAVVARAEELVRVVREHDWSRVARGLTVTVSVGTAQGTVRDALLTDLSAAVRAAKRAGRDRSAGAAARPGRCLSVAEAV